MEKARHQRSRRLVDNLQYKLIVRLVFYCVVYQLTLWNVLFCWRLIAAGRGNVVAEYKQFCGEFYPIWLCFLVLVPVFAWDAVKVSHQIAGPIYRFRQTIRAIIAGQPLKAVRLRENDALVEMNDEINAMIDVLERRIPIAEDSDANGADSHEPLANRLEPVIFDARGVREPGPGGDGENSSGAGQRKRG